MSTEIAVRQTPVAELEVMSQHVAKSGMYGMSREQVFVLMQLAEADGLLPIEALRVYDVIEGKPAMKAAAMQAKFQKNGGRVKWVKTERDVCEAVFYHKEFAPEGFAVKVTFEELDREKVTQSYDKDKREWKLKKNWRCWPRQMLRARAISEGIRAVHPGLVVGIYTPEEISDFDRHEVAIPTTARVVEPEPERERVVIERPAKHDGVFSLDAPTVKERHQPVEEVVAEMADAEQEQEDDEPAAARPYGSFVFDACRAANQFWRTACVEDGVSYVPVVSQFQVENHLGSWAVENGMAKPEHILNARGTRDRAKLVGLLSKLFAKNPERFKGLVSDYIGGKLKAAGKNAGCIVEAEDESQEAPEAELEAEGGGS